MSRRTSIVWNFCSVLSEEKKTAKCNLCKAVMSYKASVSNLKKHLIRKHPTVRINEETIAINNSDAEQDIAIPIGDGAGPSNRNECVSTKGNSEDIISSRCTTKTTSQMKISTFIPKKMTMSSKRKIDAELLKLFYDDYQPFSIVEDKGFRQFVKALNSNYEIPSRQVISRTLIPSLYEQCLNDTKQAVNNILAASLTVDCWTSSNNESFMGVTIHYIDDEFKFQSVLLQCAVFGKTHTARNLSEELKIITNEWGLEKKIFLAVSDNASNIKSAIKDWSNWNFFGCYAHTLNLIVRDAITTLSFLDGIIEKVKSIVSHFKRSPKATTKLINFQENSGVKTPKKLLQDVITRWNSTFYMIERFIELEEAIRSTVALLDTTLPQLSLDEWRILKELKQILEPFEDATRAISGQKYMTASLIIIITGGLLDVCQELLNSDLTTFSKTVVNKLQNGLKERVGNVEYNSIMAKATFLDPRFKTLPFKNNDAAVRVKKSIIADLAGLISERETEIPTTSTEEPRQQIETKQHKLSIWSSLDKIVSQEGCKITNKTSTSKAIAEVDRYMEDDIVDRKKDPLEWWNNNKYIYPNLSLLVRHKCSAVATSVPCESLFSKAGSILCERRNRLSSKKVQQLLFLNYNSRFCVSDK